MDTAEKVQAANSTGAAQFELKDKSEKIENADPQTSCKSVEPLNNLCLNTHKAGMQGLDAAKINEIIRKASEGSRYYQHKQQAQQRLDAKIQEMLRTAASLSVEQLEKASKKMETMARRYEEERDLSRTIVHVDMDMFYAAVEMRDQPHLRSVPMAVGSNSMLSTSNYLARQYGVRAGMPGFIGRQLCPELVLVSPNFSKYKAGSKIVQEVFALYDPNYAMMSLDEAYLDITDYMEANADNYLARSNDHGETLAETIVREMRLKIEEATELTASAGIAANTRLAKVCSDLNKPNGQYYLPPDEGAILDFVQSLPIRKISGIGNVTEQQLKALGISLCGELRPNYGRLRLLFSESAWHYFVRISLGLGETDLTNYTGGEQKSISTETTFAGTSCRKKLLELVSDLSVELHRDMTKKKLVGKLVTLKTKTVDFVLKTRSIPLGEPTDDPQVISNVARKLLIQEIEKCSPECPSAYRLLGVRMSNLSESNGGKEKQVTISKMFQKLAESEVSSKDDYTHEADTNEVESDEDKPENVNISAVDYSSPIKKTGMSPPKSPQKTKYDCPVCGKAVQTKFLSTFNKHIDVCLENKNETLNNAENLPANFIKEPSVPTALVPNSTCDTMSTSVTRIKVFAPEISSNNSQCSTAPHKKPELPPTGPTTSSFFASRSQSSSNKQLANQSLCHKRLMLEEVDKSIPVSASSGGNDQLLCPVCNSATFSSNEPLNLHLDRCLIASAGTAPSESSNPSNESVPDSKTYEINTNFAFTREYEEGSRDILSASSVESRSAGGTANCDSGSSKSVDNFSSNKSSLTSLKRKVDSKIPTSNKRKAAGADIPITSFFS